MSYNLFLDDIRNPGGVNYRTEFIEVKDWSLYRLKEWAIVKDYNEFVKTIKERGLPKLISFDHDLADAHYDPATWKETFSYKEKTGYNAAQWLVDYCLDNQLELPEFKVHSQNPVGAKNIYLLLINFKNHQRETKT